MSLNWSEDFAKAYDGPPTDPKAFEEQQKKLQEELQKRAEETRKKRRASSRLALSWAFRIEKGPHRCGPFCLTCESISRAA